MTNGFALNHEKSFKVPSKKRLSERCQKHNRVFSQSGASLKGKNLLPQGATPFF